MSTVTPFLNLVKPAPLEPFSLSTYNNNLDLIDTAHINVNNGAKGYVAYSELAANSAGINTEAVVLNIASFTFKANRRYRIGISGNATVDATGSTFTFRICTCAVIDAFALTTGLTQVRSTSYKFDSSGESRGPLNGIAKENYTVAADTTVQIKLTAQRSVGTTGSVTIQSGATDRACLYIEDLGDQF